MISVRALTKEQVREHAKDGLFYLYMLPSWRRAVPCRVVYAGHHIHVDFLEGGFPTFLDDIPFDAMFVQAIPNS